MLKSKLWGLLLLLCFCLPTEAQNDFITVRNLSLSQAVAVKSKTVENSSIGGLLAKEAYELHKSSGGKNYDRYIYTSLYKAVERLETDLNNNPKFNILDQVHPGYQRMGAIRSICTTKDDEMYTTGSDGTLLRWQITTYKDQVERRAYRNVPVLVAKDNKVFRAMSLSPDGKYLVRGGDAREIEIYDTEKEKISAKVNAHKGRRIWVLGFMPDSKGFISSGDDGSIQYNNLNGKSTPILSKLPEEITRLTSMAISGNGKYLIGVGNSPYVWIWDISTGKVLRKIAAQSDIDADLKATAVAVGGLHDQFISVGYQDGSIRIWDLGMVSNNQLVVPERLKSHSASIKDIAFNSDGSMMVVGSLDKTATIWKISEANGEGTSYPYREGAYMPIKLADHEDWIMAVAFSQDDSKIITGTSDGMMRVWEVDPAVYAEHICRLTKANLPNRKWLHYIGTDDPEEKKLYIKTNDGFRSPLSTCVNSEGQPCPQLKQDN